MDNNISIIKIGGNVVDNPQALDRFAADFSRVSGPKILIHGGGKEATRLASRLEIPTTMVEGRRVTSADTLEVVTMVYAGLVNKRVVGALRRHGCNAIGLSGIDAGVIPAHRRPASPIDYGFVGDIITDDINAPFIDSLLRSGLTPVFCALAYDTDGDTLLNCNADSVASAVAIASARIGTPTLTFCFEKDGVMANLDDPDSLIPMITPGSFALLKAEGVIAGGMIPKISNALAAIEQGVKEVRICRSDLLDSSQGTVIKA